MNTIFVKPRDGVQVRHPDGTVLSPDGETVPRTPYWLRRESDGDVIVTAAAPKPKKGASK